MTDLVLTALGLAIAGIDPAGAAIALAALARGASRRTITAYAAIVVLGTAAVGTTLSLTLGPELGALDWGALLSNDTAAWIELAAAIVLAAWAVVRLGRPTARPKRPRAKKERGALLLLAAGGLFALSAILDPTFVGLVVVAGRNEPAVGVAAAHTLWVVVSQFPLVGLAIAAAFGVHRPLVAKAGDVWQRISPVAQIVLTVALILAAVVLGADALKQLLTGRFLIAPDG